MLEALQKWTRLAARVCAWVSMAAVAAMMLLTCADVILRLFRMPIPGTYEVVGLLGAVFAAFALAHTSLERGHIAVDVLVLKLSARRQAQVEALTTSVTCLLFALICRQCAIYAGDLRASGEVSMTLEMPLHPFVYGIAVGTAVLTAVLAVRVAVLVDGLLTDS